MTDNLAPCPFCGGEPKLRTHRSGEDSMECYVECPSCEVRTTYYEDAYAPVADATGAWNRRTPPPSSHVAPADTVTVAQHMKDFEAFVAATAPKLHWKVYQDLGRDPPLSNGYYDGWQHGFGEEVLGPLPVPQLMQAMKDAVRRKMAALATTEGSTP